MGTASVDAAATSGETDLSGWAGPSERMGVPLGVPLGVWKGEQEGEQCGVHAGVFSRDAMYGVELVRSAVSSSCEMS